MVMNKEEIEQLFYSNFTIKEIAEKLEINEKTVRNIWKRKFGKYERKIVKEYLDKDTILKIEELFFTDIPITKLETQLGVDQRKIRKVWRNKFGSSKRKIRPNNPNYLKEDIIEKINELVLQDFSSKEIAEKLNICANSISNNIKNDVLEQLKENNKNRSRKFLADLRAPFKLSEKKKQEVAEYFETDLFPEEIAKIVGLSRSSVYNIFKEIFGIKKYKERVSKLKPIKIKKTFEKLEMAGKLGSKAENKFCEVLTESLNIFVKHHDLDVFPPFEIDITIPELKIAICWDGIGHFKPIFGEKIFRVVQNRDEQKRRKLKNDGWIVINIKDLNSHIKIDFIMEQKEKILELIKSIGREDIIK